MAPQGPMHEAMVANYGASKNARQTPNRVSARQELIAKAAALRSSYMKDIMENMPAFANGGAVFGPGSGTSDDILARLSNGEFVVNAAATKRFLPMLEAINGGNLPAFAKGGQAGSTGASTFGLLNSDKQLKRLKDELELLNLSLTTVAVGSTSSTQLQARIVETNDLIAERTQELLDEQKAKNAKEAKPKTFQDTEFGESLNANLSATLSRKLAEGDFSNIGDTLKHTILETMQSSLEKTMKKDLETIFTHIFSSIEMPSMGGSSSGGGMFSSLFKGLGGLFGGPASTSSVGVAAMSPTGNPFGFSSGGLVPNMPGSGDRVPAMLTPGELVVPAKSFDDIMGNNSAPATNVNINISGNVDQRAIEQIRNVVSSSPEVVGQSNHKFKDESKGLTRRRRR